MVVHCAAWTAVDLAEDMEEKVRQVNTVGTENIVKAVKTLDASRPEGCKMVYLSTDYVFDGQGTTPWEADCKDPTLRSIFTGKTKLEGELAVSGQLEKYFIVRIAWVFGQNGKNFIKTMLNVGKHTTNLQLSTIRSAHRPTLTILATSSGRYDRNRQIWLLSRHQRGRIY